MKSLIIKFTKTDSACVPGYERGRVNWKALVTMERLNSKQLSKERGIVADLVQGATGDLTLEDLYLALSSRRQDPSSIKLCIWDYIDSVSAFVRDSESNSQFNRVCSAVKLKSLTAKGSAFQEDDQDELIYVPRSRMPLDIEIFHMQWEDSYSKTCVQFVQFFDVKTGHVVSFKDKDWMAHFNSFEFIKISKFETPYKCLQYKRDAIAWIEQHMPDKAIDFEHNVQAKGYKKTKRRKLSGDADACITAHVHLDYSAFEKIDWPRKDQIDKVGNEDLIHDALRKRYSHLHVNKLTQVLNYAKGVTSCD
jgi:hypothetical protein